MTPSPRPCKLWELESDRRGQVNCFALTRAYALGHGTLDLHEDSSIVAERKNDFIFLLILTSLNDHLMLHANGRGYKAKKHPQGLRRSKLELTLSTGQNQAQSL